MMRRVVTILVVLVIIFLLALPKLNLFKQSGPKPGASTPTGGGGALSVEALIVKTSAFDNKLILTGSVQANETVELRPEASGKIEEIFFKEGKSVKRGELLVQINDDEIKAQLEKEKFNRKLNEDNEFRQRKLLEKDAISQEEYDNALNRLNTNIADIKLLEARLSNTRITAPFDGTIGLRYVSDGAYVTPNTNIATLYNLSPAKIEFAVPGRYSTQVRSGQSIQFQIDNDQRIFNGEVYAIEPQVDANTRTLRIRAVADNKNGALLPGQFVKVELILQTVQNAILVPTEAVIPDLNGHKVFVKEEGKAKEVQVKTGVRNESTLEIVEGLTEGDTLLTTGMLQLRSGMKVQAVKVN
jgi:membrane fusion protein, multidrug efflux system